MNSKVMLAVAAAFASGAVFAAPTIEITKVQQRWPWNNKLDITYTVTDGQSLTDDPAGDTYYKVVFTTTIAGTEYTIDGDAVGASANSGTHTVTWKGAPSGVESDSLQMSAALYSATAPSGDDYMIVQLTGADAGKVTFEGLLKTQALSNARYNVAEYKTGKMVFRKIPAGGPYTTGTTSTTQVHGKNSLKTWTTYRDFYTAIFPVTRGQYSTIVGSDPSTEKNASALSGSELTDRPVEHVSWNLARGTGSDPKVEVEPAADGTFLQRLNFLTRAGCGVTGFDLPTEVMCEIAGRAGTTGYYYWGADSYNQLPDYIVYSGNSGNTTAAVGSRKPNEWGLFDVSGNVWEWTRDKYTTTTIGDIAAKEDPFTPNGNAGDTYAVYRGGGGFNKEISHNYYRIYARYVDPVTTGNYSTLGFRVAWIAD